MQTLKKIGIYYMMYEKHASKENAEHEHQETYQNRKYPPVRPANICELLLFGITDSVRIHFSIPEQPSGYRLSYHHRFLRSCRDHP